MSSVVTRFAPSPTGFLHIGGARTALFNWLYAKHTGGKFLIRIEDTDRERSTEAAVAAIFEGLDWLGLRADDEIIFQHANANRHKEVVMQLLASGRAYRCYMTADETEAAREKAREDGHALRSPWRDKEGNAELPHVIRFKGPLDGDVIILDAVQGDVKFNARDLDDLILLRSDGNPTYNLAVVVDDHDMGVTHVIRGDDHLNNAARQSLIYQAAGWDVPQFAHIPLIHGPDGAKLSKRHGAQAIGDYQQLGYLPEAMRNYLARLGWSHGDDEIFSDQDAISWFDITDINRAPSRLDFAKLGHINAHWLRNADTQRLVSLVRQQLVFDNVALVAQPELDERLSRTIGLVVERAQTISELAMATLFATATYCGQIDEKTKNMLNDETKDRLTRLWQQALEQSDFSCADLDTKIKKFLENEGVGMGKIGPTLRGLLSNGHAGPDISKIFYALGKKESHVRLKAGLFI